MSHDEPQPDAGFKVNDRRRFDTDGNDRDPNAEDVTATARAGDSAPEAVAGAQATGTGNLPEIDFSTFVLSLGTSTMVHLGQAPHPDGTEQPDLELARQSIDLLGMLKEKTRGNLTDDESRLLDDLLYDLRLRFVTASQR